MCLWQTKILKNGPSPSLLNILSPSYHLCVGSTSCPFPAPSVYQNIQNLHTMNNQRKKGGRKGMDPENVIEAAIENGLSEDKAGIDSKPVSTELAEKN